MTCEHSNHNRFDNRNRRYNTGEFQPPISHSQCLASCSRQNQILFHFVILLISYYMLDQFVTAVSGRFLPSRPRLSFTFKNLIDRQKKGRPLKL